MPESTSQNEPNWDLVRSFLAVLETKSLSAAARQLGTTQPTVGRHIDALEQHFSSPLFVRSRYGLSPTPAALDLLPYAEAMGGAAKALARAASGAVEESRGTIRVTASQIVGTEILPPLLALFRERHGAIDIELAVTNDSENLLRRDADIAVRMFRPEQGALIARKIGSSPIGLFAHRGYLQRHGTPKSLADLDSHAAIGPDANVALFRRLAASGVPIRREQLAFRTDFDPAQHALIRSGAGIGGMQIALGAQEPELVQILADEVTIAMEIWLVMHENLRSSRRVRLLFEYLAEGLKQYAERN